MGYNTTVVVMNDALDQIKNDPAFGEKLARAVMGFNIPVRGKDVAAGNFVNAATVVSQHHADAVHLVAVGGNYGRDLGHVVSWRDQTDDEKILRALADKLGYTLRKKTTRKVA